MWLSCKISVIVFLLGLSMLFKFSKMNVYYFYNQENSVNIILESVILWLLKGCNYPFQYYQGNSTF